MNNNNYKWETVGKSKFYTDGTTCTDIEVMDNAKTVSFIYPKIRINRGKCQKVFSSVENLIIGRDVFSIIIPNKLFALAIIRPGNIHRTRCINVHIDNQDGIFNFVLPCSISATASVYGAYSNAGVLG